MTGEYTLALQDYTRAIEIHPGYALAYNNRADVYRILKDYDKSIADCLKAVEYNPGYSSAFNNLGYTYYLKKSTIKLTNITQNQSK
jgi:tetratricopeptide (TPR) repeat protein